MDTGSFDEFLSLVKEVWENGLYGVDIGHIVVAVSILALFLILRNLLTRFFINRIKSLASKTKTDLDDTVVDALEQPIRFIPVLLGIFFAISSLNLDQESSEFASNVNRSLIAFVIFWALYRASDPVSELLQTAERFLTRSMIEWLSKAIKLAFALLGGATILEIWGIQVGPLIAGLGLFGVAVALGAQDLFKNLIAGLFIIGEKRFHPGDWILVSGVVEGTVEHIGFRTTTVRRFDKAPVYVPNASLADSAVTNFSRMTFRRIKWLIGLEYSATAEQLEAVRAGIEEYLDKNTAFARPEDTATFVRIDRFSDSSIDILLYCFTNTTDWLEWLAIKEGLLLEIKRIVASAGTDFAFPSRTLYLEAMGDDLEVAPLHGSK
ncbi:mechanosensitive ion channel family protein [Kordiimonas sp. SCSIO 12603]|uniref:mechanosensitive ion channel family protein n=1 Tax=Kordiimonas sp. SCSIO 12603 TaxID=2829596 RepID=UPI002104D9FF|nr:mechanosensitive ion channel family protein [Kordiimonas sp. SCSIO 12603]UTW57853.1 mechanosensitive ion channel family protein [Kordiimonas sp. SCSIO 12603]